MVVVASERAAEPLLEADVVDQAGRGKDHHGLGAASASMVRGWRQVLLWRVLPTVGLALLPFLALSILSFMHTNGTVPSLESRSINAIQSKRINMLQWNPHVECYLHHFGARNGCKSKAFALIKDLLQGGTPYNFKARQFDFATIEYTGFAQALTLPKPWANLTYDCSKHGPGDDITFLFNSELWTPLGFKRSGCMGLYDRHAGGYSKPFVAMAFKSTKHEGMTVLVVGAHFNHPDHNPNPMAFGFWESDASKTTSLKDAVSEAASEGITNLIVMADTNSATGMKFPWPTDVMTISSTTLMTEIGAANAGNTKTTYSGDSCCWGTKPPWNHIGYDRIMANFGKHMETEMGLSSSVAAEWRSRYIHLPVVGSLSL